MITIKSDDYRPYFQGDLMIRRIDTMPAAKVVEPEVSGKHILAHSETGHHHVIASRAAQLLIDETNAFIGYLAVSDLSVVEHLRAHDTHEAYLLEPGNYEIRRQREHVPEGWRRAAD